MITGAERKQALMLLARLAGQLRSGQAPQAVVAFVETNGETSALWVGDPGACLAQLSMLIDDVTSAAVTAAQKEKPS